MQFHTLDLALAAQQAIVPLVHRIQRHDRRLAQQMKDATNSFSRPRPSSSPDYAVTG